MQPDTSHRKSGAGLKMSPCFRKREIGCMAWRGFEFTLRLKAKLGVLHMLRIVVVGVALLFSQAAWAGGAVVNPPPAKPAAMHQRACWDDIDRFCSSVEYGGGRRLACLARHEKELTPACKPRLKMMQAAYADAQKQLQQNRKQQTKQPAGTAKQSTTAGGKPATPPPAQPPKK
jgi:hypothetical protein